MTDNQREIQRLAASLEEIKHLEAKLSSLKRHILESSSSALTELLAEGESASFLIVRVLERNFAIPLGGVEEVVEMVETVPLADPLPGVVGLLNYHGDFIVMFDLAEISGLGRNSISADNVVVICIMDTRRFAVMINEATDVITVPKTQIQIADDMLSGVMREIAVIKAGRDSASVIDIWSAVLSLPLAMRAAERHPEQGTNTISEESES